MKRITTYLLAVCLLATVLSVCASAEVIAGSCGKNVNYTLDLDSKTLTITGEGEIDWLPEGEDGNSMEFTNYWFRYRTQIETVVVGEGITALEEHAFYCFTELTRVELPESLTVINYAAFEGCEKLRSIRLPSHLERIEVYAFGDCASLESLTLPKTLTEFHGESVNGGATRYGCGSLAAIHVEDGNPAFVSRDGVLFSKDGAILVCYPSGKTQRSYTVPAEVREIEPFAFSNCTALRSVTGSGSVRKIGYLAFGGCTALESVRLGSTQQEIDEFVFGSCRNLREVYYDYDPYYFRDVYEQTYYAAPVAWAVKNEITNGVRDNCFQPNGICTRAQIVTFLWRAAGSPRPEISQMPFEDVKLSYFCHDAVLWAVENHITTGKDPAHFAPDGKCTRAEAVTFLWRAAQIGEAASENDVDGDNRFTDVSSNSYYYDAVRWAVKNGITTGLNDTTFGPDRTCTRAQIVTFLYRDMCKET